MRSALIPEGQCGGWTFLTRCLNATTVPVVSETLLDTALTASKQTSRSKVLAWAMWDWGTQPFNTVITTFVFSVYITSAAFGEVNHTSRALAVSTTIGGLVVALLAPVLGQMTDRSGRCVTVLRGLTWSLSLISMSLFLVAPQPDFLWFGLGALAVGSVISEIAGASYNSLIEQVASDKDVGLVSGFGWGMGYLGGIVVLVLLFFGFISPEVGLFGVSDDNGMDVRVSMVVCGLWTLVFTIPTFVKLKDPPRTESVPVPRAERWAGRRPELIWLMLAPADRHGASALGYVTFHGVVPHRLCFVPRRVGRGIRLRRGDRIGHLRIFLGASGHLWGCCQYRRRCLDDHLRAAG